MFVLVVTRQARVGELVRQTLGAEGWWVTAVADRETAVRSASGQAPQLVVVDGESDDAAELVRFFSRRHGGPGVLLLAAAAGDDVGAGEADEVLAQPAAGDELAAAASRLLAEPQEAPGDGLPTPGQVLNAQDIFGDMLLELEGDSALAAPPPPPAAPRRAVTDRVAASSLASAVMAAPESPAESAPPPLAAAGPVGMEPPVDTRPMVIPQPSPELVAPLDLESEIDSALDTAIGAASTSAGGEVAPATPAAADAGDQPEDDGPPVDEASASDEEPRPIDERGEREQLAATVPADSEVAADESVEAAAAPDPMPPSEDAAAASPSSPVAQGARRWKSVSLPGGVRFWLGLAAGLLVFLAASLLLERLFPAPAAEPAPITVPATDAVDLEQLVDQEMAKREAELRESLLEEERRLQQQLDELESDN